MWMLLARFVRRWWTALRPEGLFVSHPDTIHYPHGITITVDVYVQVTRLEAETLFDTIADIAHDFSNDVSVSLGPVDPPRWRPPSNAAWFPSVWSSTTRPEDEDIPT